MTDVRLAAVVLSTLAAGCAEPAPPSATPAPTVDDERRADVAAYEKGYVPQRAALTADHKGEWVAIAGGRIVPSTGESAAPVATMEEADAAARSAAPRAMHRFIFRIGEEGDVDWSLGGCELPHVLGTYFIALLERDDVDIRFSTKRPSIQWREVDRLVELVLPSTDLRMHVRPEVGAPGAPGTATESYCVSTGFGGFATMSADSAAGLELWEIPGTVHVEGVLRNGDCRRARARFRWPNTPLDFVVPVAIWAK